MGGYHWALITTQPILVIVFVTSALLLPAVTLHFHHVYPRPKPWLERHPRLTLLAIYAPSVLMTVALVAVYFWVRHLGVLALPVATFAN